MIQKITTGHVIMMTKNYNHSHKFSLFMLACKNLCVIMS